MWIPKSEGVDFQLFDVKKDVVEGPLSHDKVYEAVLDGIKDGAQDLRYYLQAMTKEDFENNDEDVYRYRSETSLKPVVRDGQGELAQRFKADRAWGQVRFAFVQECDERMTIEEKRGAVGFGTDDMYEIK